MSECYTTVEQSSNVRRASKRSPQVVTSALPSLVCDSKLKNEKLTLIQDDAGHLYRVVQVPNCFFDTSAQQMQDDRSIPEAVIHTPNESNNPEQYLQAFDQETGHQYCIMIQTSTSSSCDQSTNDNAPQSVAKRETVRQTNKRQRRASEAIDSLSLEIRGKNCADLASTEKEGLEWPPKQPSKRRVTHNEVEKRRRDKINSWIDHLATLVPMSLEDAHKSLHSKGVILAHTVDYVTELKNANARLTKMVADLHQRISLLEQQNKDSAHFSKIVDVSTNPLVSR